MMDINDFEQYEPFYNFQLSVKERAIKFQTKYNLPLSSIMKKVINEQQVEEELYFVPKFEKTTTGLKLPDGRIIGHKEFKLFFDQNVRPERPVSDVINTKLQLTENGNNETLPLKRVDASKTNKSKLM